MNDIMAVVELYDDSRARRKVRSIERVGITTSDSVLPERIIYRGYVMVDGEPIFVRAACCQGQSLTDCLWRVA